MSGSGARPAQRPRGVVLGGDGFDVGLDDRLVYLGFDAVHGIHEWAIELFPVEMEAVSRGKRSLTIRVQPPHHRVSLRQLDQ
jgi:hypothetical protein